MLFNIPESFKKGFQSSYGDAILCVKKSLKSGRSRLLVVLSLFCSVSTQAQQLAFPGAEGFGKYATGGRTGSVYHVTNLNDTGTGSLRDALSKPNRIVVFDVGGVIKIVGRMIVSANIYIAGQTAPGEGITVYGNGWSFTNAHNTICRYMKIRMGVVGTSGKDANGIAEGHDMIFDHCSVSWGRDETFSINSPEALRITIQNSIISQGMLVHSAGGLIQTDGGVTLYRNLYADNGTRNNKVKGVNQYVNNIVYNWDAGAYIMGGDSEGQSFANAIGNAFIQGPVAGTRPFSVGNSLFHIYANDNIHDNNQNGIFDGYQIPESEFGGGPDFQAGPYSYPALPTVAASSLISESLPTVGANLPYRDLVDYYVVNEVKSFGKEGKFLSNENELPFGVPTSLSFWAGTKRQDTDNDGIPDAWESSNGLNPNSASDAMTITANGYTNIENYINSIDASYSQYHLRAPLVLKTDSTSQTTASISWLDYTENEKGYIIEQKIGTDFFELVRTEKDINFYTITGLTPEQRLTLRVKAYDQTSTSAASNELSVKTKPVPVAVLNVNTFTPDLTWNGDISKTWDKTTNNWLSGGNTAPFSDDKSVLFETSATAQSITLTEQAAIKDMVVSGSSDYSFLGAGAIAGNGSVNKTGTGKLALLNSNNYKGATVLYDGTLEVDKLANGGLVSSIGSSANYAFNWVLKGGKVNYTGATTSTDRSISLDAPAEIGVNNTGAVVSITGNIAGSGSLIKSGPGTLALKSVNTYEGETVIKAGVIEVSGSSLIDGGLAIGASNVLRLKGGTYRTISGSNSVYENYPMNLIIEAGTSSGFEPYRNAHINCHVSGSGTLTYAITYSRELIQGDWSQFTGTLIAKGVGTLTGAERSMLMLNNVDGIPNARVEASGNTKITCWKNAVTMYLGGLSGASTTLLTCGNKTAGGSITWVVGGAGTDETFNGVINNDAYSSGTGTTTIVKEGSGIWRLTGANTYSGTTTVNNGTLIVNGTHSGAGKITVTEGTLAGRGTLKGDVEIQTGAVIQPGDNSINTFTLQGKLNLSSGSVTEVEVNKTTATWDKLTVTGVVTFGGTLKVNFTGTPVVGAVYKIFNQTAGPVGNFSSIQPASPGEGMLWSFTPSTGELKIIEGSLPVKLSSFTAKEDGSGVKLAWTTVSEENNDRFEIERSNGSFFTSILTVKGKGTTKSANNYSVYDFNPVKGINYYRLMQYDLNGKGTEYGIREVKSGLDDASLQVYPNPIIDEFSVKLSVDSPSLLHAELRTMDGEIAAKLAPAVKIGNEFKYRLGQKIASGVYILQLSNESYKATKKILIN